MPAPARPRSLTGRLYLFCGCGASFGNGTPRLHHTVCDKQPMSWAQYRKAFPDKAAELVRLTSQPAPTRVSYQPGYDPAERTHP
jgi:hypothetical protein